jgi:DNA modification methylase
VAEEGGVSIRVIVGDVRAKLADLADESVHCVVTSPPYFGLRDYGTASWEGGDPDCDHLGPPMRTNAQPTNSNGTFHGGATRASEPMGKSCNKCGATRTDKQIGLEATPAEFVAVMVEVFREVRRVLRSDGTLFLNLGDSYQSSGPRQTGRNDTTRETPGGRGGSFRGGERRAIVCDTVDKEPEGSPAHDCFCQSLCGACREAYRIGIVHSGHSPDPMPPSSNSLSSRERRGSPSGHLPTSGLARQGDHSSDARSDQQLLPAHVAGQPLSSPASTPDQSYPQLPADFPRSDQPSGCRLCGCSLADCAPASAHTAACICGTADGASADHTTDKDSWGSAYPHLTTAALKPKDLIGIPWRVAFALQADGWYLRQDIIWSKPNPMPESVTDRCTKAHEYLFLLSKSPRYHYDAEAIAEPAQDWTNGGPGTGIRETHHYGAGNGGNAGLIRNAERYKAGDSPTTRNRRSVWTVATQAFSAAHFASTVPGVVLDCFGGAGTTGLVADRLQRDAILIELNPAYAALATNRITDDGPLFAEVSA